LLLAAYPEGSLVDQFLQLIGGAAFFFIQDRHLFIDLFADGGTLELVPLTE
jgi:hypothetical protein